MLIANKIQWSRTADVVVVGFGAAGAVSAITAHDLGAEILILEKQPAHTHISTSHMSGGIWVCPNDVAGAITYMEHLNKVNEELYWTDRDITQVWAEYTSQNTGWIKNLGGKVKLRMREGEHDVPGTESIETWGIAGMGVGLMRLLKDQLKSRGVQVLYDTAADRLLTNVRGEVIGVRAHTEGKEINVKASQAVIMTTGGFEFNEEMKLNYLPVYPTYFAGSPANTGDGIKMAQEVGASLWHMNCCSASWQIKLPDWPISVYPDLRRYYRGTVVPPHRPKSCGYIIVDKYGRRYTNEIFKGHTVYYELAAYDSYSLDYPRAPSYWIFDRKQIEAGPVVLMSGGPMKFRKVLSYYKWSKDNKEELEKGWIIQGHNLEALAHKLGITPSVLEKTVQNYNAYCEQKEDPEFHRPPQHLVPLTEPPFFAVKIWPGSANTQGGPRRNKKGQILDTDAKPIPRLYAAGELGSVYGLLYPLAGGNIAECLAFGRIAGENAVKETQLS